MRIAHLIALSFLLATAACGKKAEPAPDPAKVEKKTEDPKPDDHKEEAKPAEVKPSEEKPVEVVPADPMASWVAFTGPDNTYTAKFPSKPSEDSKEVPVEGGLNQTLKSAVAESPDGAKAYFTALADIKVAPGTAYDAKKGIDLAVSGVLNGLGGQQDASETVNWGAFEGRKLTYHGTKDGVDFKGVALVYASSGDKARIYQANTINMGGPITEDMNQFIASFSLNEPKDAKPVDAQALVADQVAGAWINHETPLYTVKLPSAPTESKSPLPTVIGEREMVMYASVTGTGGYMIGSVDMQVPAGTPFDVKAAMDGARDGILKSVGGDPAKAKVLDVETGGLKGQEISFVAEQKLEGKEIGGRVRMFLDEAGGKKVYALIAIGLTPLDEAGIKTFFESFVPKK